MAVVSPRSRRELGAAVLACLLGAVLVLLSLVRDWARVPVEGGALLPDRLLGVSGGALVPGVRALALVGLAGVVGLAATRGRGRRAVGAVIALVGVAVLVETTRTATDLASRVGSVDEVREAGGGAGVDATPWPVLAVVGAVLLVAAGLLVATRGSRWSALSERYDAPVAGGGRPPPVAAVEGAGDVRPDKALWDDLDRGEDPTTG